MDCSGCERCSRLGPQAPRARYAPCHRALAPHPKLQRPRCPKHPASRLSPQSLHIVPSITALQCLALLAKQHPAGLTGSAACAIRQLTMSPPPDPSTTAPIRLATLLPAWNPGDRLARTLASIAAQNTPCKIFVVDDGSEPALQTPTHAGPHEIHLLRLEKNEGIAAALNAGLSLISKLDFEFVARHDAGDIDVNNRLQRQINYLDEHPDVSLVGSSAEFCDATGKRFTFRAPEGDHAVHRKMRYSAAIVHSTCMFRMSALQAIGGYSESDKCAEDYELFFRMMPKFQLDNVPEILVRADYNADGISISQRRQSLASRLRLQHRYFKWTSMHSYLGVLQTCLLFIAPNALVASIKRRLGSNRPPAEDPK